MIGNVEELSMQDSRADPLETFDIGRVYRKGTGYERRRAESYGPQKGNVFF
jgi:hypothetical protein